jgi:hypothetical protein
MSLEGKGAFKLANRSCNLNAKQQAKMLEKEIITALGQDWTENINQKVGVAYDYVLPDGTKTELKCDLASATTGNFFFEMEQQLGGGAWRPSGIALAIEQANSIIFANAEEVLRVNTQDLAAWLPYNGPRFRTRTTHDGANGNRDGNSARGILVPRAELRKLAASRYVRAAPGTFIEDETLYSKEKKI